MTFLSAQVEQLNRIITEAVESKSTPSLVFGAIDVDGGSRFVHAGPRIPSDPFAGPMDEDTTFWMCSSTKLIVTIAVLQLIEQGKLAYDTVVSTILPEAADPVIVDFSQEHRPVIRPAKTPITVRHLCNHTSGLSYVEANTDVTTHLVQPYQWPHDPENPVSYFINQMKGANSGIPLMFEPGTDYTYGFSTDYLGFMIERITGETLEQYFKKNILLPLGMNSTSFYLTPDLEARKAELQYREKDGTLTPFAGRTPLLPPGQVSLHVTVYSSVRDYLTLCQHLLQIHTGRATAATPILQRESVLSMFEPTLPEKATKTLSDMFGGVPSSWSSGLCVNLTDTPGMRRKGSAHWFGWAGTYYCMDPESGIATMLAAQLVPSLDAKVLGVWAELEKTVYSSL